jgi:hypothetical protein|tara:strand:+ start:3406 stop:3642 length:237 start_codon:yes stop_codon:yes gene_type:complete
MQKLKDLLKKWKVEVSLVGGALVVATAYGSCVYEPPVDEETPAVEASTSEATDAVENAEATTTAEETTASESSESTGE